MNFSNLKFSNKEPEEADAAESMLTLTQCSSAGNLSNGNIYIITKPSLINANTIRQQSPIKNQQIAFLAQPIIHQQSTATTATTINQPATISIRPVIQLNKQLNQNIITTTGTTSTTAPQFSTDHNYFNRNSSIKPISNVITIPISSITSVAGQQLIVNSNSNTVTKANFIPIINNNNNKNVNKIITITTNASPAKNVTIKSPTKNVIIKSPIKSPEKARAKDQDKKQTPTKKQKVVNVVNDEDGLKCAEALFNLANGNLEKKVDKIDNKLDNKDQKSKEKNESVTKIKTITIQTVTTPTSTLTRSAAKKLKTSA